MTNYIILLIIINDKNYLISLTKNIYILILMNIVDDFKYKNDVIAYILYINISLSLFFSFPLFYSILFYSNYTKALSFLVHENTP
jgi:hypothetical protein